MDTQPPLQPMILQRLNSVYETDFTDSVPDKALLSQLSLTPQQLELAISPLLAEGLIEKWAESVDGFNLRLTALGKLLCDQQAQEQDNARIRENILAFLSSVYEEDVRAISNSNDIANRLGLTPIQIGFNLKILETEGSVHLQGLHGAGAVFYNVTLTPHGKHVHDNPPPKLVFVSHAAVDETVALLFKVILETAFPGIQVFVSSDPEDLRPGDSWVEVILSNLRNAQLVVVLATQRALTRKWVWYESGATWSRGVRVVPCCVGTLRKGGLPPPFSAFQAVNIDEPRDFQYLVNIIADDLRLPKPQSLDVVGIIHEIKEAESKILAANPSFLPPDEIEGRLRTVQLGVRLDQGTGEWFILLLENQSSEEIDIEMFVLETKDGHRLAEPCGPKPGEIWNLSPTGRLSMQCQLQPDPCVQILRLHDWPKSNFSMDVNFKFLCRILNHKKWCERLLRVQVDCGARRLYQFVG
jgi:TIR domain